mmetsp:Transcript_7646/g.25301  ORF Transcript_7646/g.25301 Transcript_7646/m.25301 type:complete len:92 (-) Transcript_7646:53-328(-)
MGTSLDEQQHQLDINKDTADNPHIEELEPQLTLPKLSTLAGKVCDSPSKDIRFLTGLFFNKHGASDGPPPPPEPAEATSDPAAVASTSAAA